MPKRPSVLVGKPSVPAEKDCACPSDELAPVYSFQSNGGNWKTAVDLWRVSLPDNHELVFDPLGYSNVVVLNQVAQDILNSFSQPRPLDGLESVLNLDPNDIDTAVRQFIDLGLLHPPDYLPQPIHLQSQTLSAWLHVTNACNLRCTYCYVSKTDSAMDEGTGRAAIEAVFRAAIRNGFRAVKLKYAGGEATLNFGLVVILHQHATDLALQNGIELYEVVLSNGVALTESMIRYLRDEDIRLMISLDGVGAAHDSQRIFANGHGSFASVVRAIDRAIANDLPPHLSITITRRNVVALSDVVSFALDLELPFNLNFFRDNDCTRPGTELDTDHAGFIAGMKEAFTVIEKRLPRQRLIDGLVDRSSFDGLHEYACGAGHSYLVIDQHGKVAGCQMEIERTITDVLVDDPLQVVRLNSGFKNVPVTEKEGCRDCAWRYWCAGGCPLLTFRATGRTDVKSPYCSVYKTLYPDVLRLEGLRLLKWGSDIQVPWTHVQPLVTLKG